MSSLTQFQPEEKLGLVQMSGLAQTFRENLRKLLFTCVMGFNLMENRPYTERLRGY